MNKQYYRFAALLPVQEDGHPDLTTGHPITTLAEDLEQATWLANDAGLVLLGQLDAAGNLMPIKP
jgi:hypothetical protein